MFKSQQLWAAALLTISSISAQASVIIEEAVVSEIPFYDAPPAGHIYGEFTVTNNTANDLYAFAVATNDPIMAMTAFGPASNNWTAVAMTAAEWNSSTLDGSPFWLAQPDNTRKLTTDFGSFESLFGAGYTGAFLYAFQNDFPNTPIASGTIESGFYFESTSLGSPFFAFALDANGNPLNLITGDSVHTSAVPLPASLWLLGSGLMGLTALARRRSRK